MVYSVHAVVLAVLEANSLPWLWFYALETGGLPGRGLFASLGVRVRHGRPLRDQGVGSQGFGSGPGTPDATRLP
jgi:hypothetical protein